MWVTRDLSFTRGTPLLRLDSCSGLRGSLTGSFECIVSLPSYGHCSPIDASAQRNLQRKFNVSRVANHVFTAVTENVILIAILRALPYELLCSVWHSLLNDLFAGHPESITDLRRPTKEYYSQLATLRLVCRHWNKIAIETPSLWIHLSSFQPPEIICLYLQRSGDHPLEVYLLQLEGNSRLHSFDARASHEHQETMARLLMDQVHRLKRLSVAFPPHWVLPNDPTDQTLTECLFGRPMPSLVELNVQNWIRWASIKDAWEMPSLRTLRSRGVRIVADDLQATRNLQYLHLEEACKTDLRVLVHHPNLRTLIVSGLSPDFNLDDLERIPLPNLRTLNLSDMRVATADRVLDTMVIPDTVHFHLSCSARDPSEIIPFGELLSRAIVDHWTDPVTITIYWTHLNVEFGNVCLWFNDDYRHDTEEIWRAMGLAIGHRPVRIIVRGGEPELSADMVEHMERITMDIQTILLERRVTTSVGKASMGARLESTDCPEWWLFQEISSLTIWCEKDRRGIFSISRLYNPYQWVGLSWIPAWLELARLRSSLPDPAPIKVMTLRCVPALAWGEEKLLREVVGKLQIVTAKGDPA